MAQEDRFRSIRVKDLLVENDLAVLDDMNITGDVVITGNNNVTGNVDITGDLTVDGNFTFGDAAVDILDVNGYLTFTGTPTTAISITATSTTAISIAGTNTNAILFGTSNGKIIDAAASISIYGGNTTGDDLVLYANSTDSEAISILGAGIITITGPNGVKIDASTKLDVNGMLDVADSLAGGASNGNIILKTLQAGQAYTGTTAGLMVKNYCADATVTVPSGEFCGLYINLKGLHVDPGHNTSLISAHVHGSNTTTVWAGLWLYGDMVNGIKASGSTLTNLLDISEATAVTNLMTLPAAGTDPVIANALVPAAAPDAGTMGADACLRVLVNNVAYYIPLYDTLHA